MLAARDPGWLAFLLAVAVVTGALAVALEAALVAVGLARAQALAGAGGARPRALLALLSDPEGTAATVRIAETVSALAAGGAAAGLGMALSPPGIPRSVTVALAVLLAAAAWVILAAAARALAVDHGEPLALWLAIPARMLRFPLAPLGRALGVLAIPLASRPGRYAPPSPPLEEVERHLAEYARQTGTASDQSTSELIAAVFDFREKVARDVMLPRTDVVAIEIDTPVPEIIRVLAEEGHSRMPVYRDNLDQIEGVLHARDLVPLLANPDLIVLRDLLRPAHFVPWSKPVDLLLREMQRKRLHMAVVVDEYGGVMGICTIEDVLEQIVGEIRDEYEEEGRAIEPHPDGTFTVRGSTPIAELNRATGVGVPEDQGYETVAGLLNALAGAIPAVGDRLFWRGWMFTVSEADPRRATRVRVARVKRTASS
jgi:CBS domain containing-hemolysin-like protein